MIDIGLTKMAIIGVVALVVIGPEKLPTVARMAGTLLGRAQRYLNQVKSEVSREIELDELRKMQKEFKDAASNVEKTIADNLADVEETIHTAWVPSSDATATAVPSADRISDKAKLFRKKKLVRVSAVPTWYKQQSGRKTRVISAAARVAKYRPAKMVNRSAGFFH
jgi:sec-independent protein translocase protein TatB